MLDSLSLYPEVELPLMRRMVGAMLLIEEALQPLPEKDRPQLAALCQALENRLAQNGGANSLVPQTSRDDSATADAPPAPVMSQITSGRALLEQAKVLAKYLRDRRGGWLACQPPSDKKHALGYGE